MNEPTNVLDRPIMKEQQCGSGRTGALLHAESLQLQHPATTSASADHDVGSPQRTDMLWGSELGGAQTSLIVVKRVDPVQGEKQPVGLYFEPEPIPSTPNYFQPREFSSCVSCEESPGFLDQIFDSYLQPETHQDPSLSSTQSTPHYFPDSFQAAPFCFNQSLTPESPSDSSTLSGSLDYNYCPAQLPSYAAESHTALPQLDTRNCGHPSGDYTYAHPPAHAQYDSFSPASICCCASCEAERLDAFRASDCFSYPSTDYVNFAPSAAASSDFYKREANWDICYS
ncbi:hypothetical protein MJT46_009907 [Ovis ammon polii x Ovis aries]|nr:hypothetical protein MJT46_009907 [Ovis ammon polii x Ovis aries]